MGDHAFDCTDNDDLFGGGKPKAAPWRAAPIRVDMSRASRGELVIKIKDAREFIEEYERLFISRNDRAFESRLQLCGQLISALTEVESRMRTALQKPEGKK